MRADNGVNPASFRDPSGFIFLKDGCLYRQVNQVYREHYEHLMKSKLYERLVRSELLIPHTEVDLKFAQTENAYRILLPERVRFLSYPYEWCFSQLKHAALAAMKIQRLALDHKMILKDSTAYNFQFLRGKPVLIDTLSFEKYNEGEPWVAYRQFCQNFLAPLALMSRKDVRLNQLLRVYIDGIPLDLASCLLPARTRLKFSLATHIHLHAKSQKHYADKEVQKGSRKMGRMALLGIMDSLESAVSGLLWDLPKTEWASYYDNTNYTADGLENKKQVIQRFVDQIRPKSVWDLGANTGLFSRLASDCGIPTIAFDADPVAVELNYRESVKKKEQNLLPLLLDLTNPSPGIGYENKERTSFMERGPADCVFALALIHHLAISNNVPLEKIAAFFARICDWLVIEFIPKSDSQVRKLLASREDIFTEYTQQNFEAQFAKQFAIQSCSTIKDSSRLLYSMKRLP